MKQISLRKYGADHVRGSGKVLCCIPNNLGVKLIQVYDIITCFGLFTLCRAYYACRQFNAEDADIVRYVQVRQITYCLQVLLSVAGFTLYTLGLAIQGSVGILPATYYGQFSWETLLVQWLMTCVLLLAFIVMEFHFTWAIKWK